MRVVMYSPDSIGLGHMRRNSTIAAEIVRQAPEASVALLIGSGAGSFFALPKGIDSIKLPSVQKIAAETWKPRSLNISAHETTRVRAAIIRDVVATMKPNVLLVDHLPLGVCGDLQPALELIRDRRLPTRIVLGLRDILDDPDVIRRRWNRQSQYAFIARHYDDVLIYGDRDVYASGDLYGLEDVLRGRVRYAGYVCSAADSGRQTAVEKRHPSELDGLAAWQPGEKIIVAAGGGGHDAYPMLSATAAALERMDRDEGFRAVVIAGPLMPDEDRKRLAQQMSGMQRTRLLPWTSDCMDYLSAAHVAVVMGGYNSALEAMSTPAHVVMIPRAGPSAEQSIRASMLSERGHVTCIEQAAAEAVTVETALRSRLAAAPRTPPATLLDGGPQAARILIEMCSQPATRARPLATGSTERSPYVVF